MPRKRPSKAVEVTEKGETPSASPTPVLPLPQPVPTPVTPTPKVVVEGPHGLTIVTH
jgi:hypothetical protein